MFKRSQDATGRVETGNVIVGGVNSVGRRSDRRHCDGCSVIELSVSYPSFQNDNQACTKCAGRQLFTHLSATSVYFKMLRVRTVRASQSASRSCSRMAKEKNSKKQDENGKMRKGVMRRVAGLPGGARCRKLDQKKKRWQLMERPPANKET